MKFMNLDEKYSGDDSYFAVVPIAEERDVTYGKGAKKGAKEIIKASKHLEYYDEQFDNEPFELGIKTTDKIPENQFFVVLGGDHSVTIDSVPEDCSVLILDAHSDFRYSWNNSMNNHACVARRLSEKHKIGIIGVRSQDKDEMEAIKNNENVHVLKAYDFSKEKLIEILDKLDSKIYISIDVDVFDISFIRNTGTPEPGGFSWNDVIEILKLVFERKNVIGTDIVEFAPKENYRAEAFSLAKLAYKLMSLKQKFKKKE